MELALVKRLEDGVGGLASACLGGAAAFLVYNLPGPLEGQPALGACAAGAAGIVYWASRRLLVHVAPHGQRLPVALDASSVAPLPDNFSAAAGLESRVVRLFDPAAALAFGQSSARIARLADHPSPAAPPDASQSFHEALNQLRESLANRQ